MLLLIRRAINSKVVAGVLSDKKICCPNGPHDTESAYVVLVRKKATSTAIDVEHGSIVLFIYWME